MNKRKDRVRIAHEFFKERVANEVGLGWVGYPEVHPKSGGGVRFDFSTSHASGERPTRRFRPIRLTAGDLSIANDEEFERLIGDKWIAWRKDYDARPLRKRSAVGA